MEQVHFTPRPKVQRKVLFKVEEPIRVRKSESQPSQKQEARRLLDNWG